jgi:hypothetical protein
MQASRPFFLSIHVIDTSPVSTPHTFTVPDMASAKHSLVVIPADTDGAVNLPRSESQLIPRSVTRDLQEPLG